MFAVCVVVVCFIVECMVLYLGVVLMDVFFVFFFQAYDGIRVAQESRGLGDVYKRQVDCFNPWFSG